MIKVNTRPSPSRAAFRTLSRRYPSYFRIDYSKPVRHAYLPFGHQATLLYDTSYSLFHRLASYEQSQFELTGKVPSYCQKELNLSQNDYEHDLRADYFLEQQHRYLEDQERQHHHAQQITTPDIPVCLYSIQTLVSDDDLSTTPFRASVMLATVPSPSSTEMPEDIKHQTPEEHVNNIPDTHLPSDPAKAQEIRDILLESPTALSLYKFDIGYIDPEKYGYARIDTGDAVPYYEPPRRFSHLEKQALHTRVREYRYSDICSDSVSPWASNPLMVPKKDTDQTVDDYRLCIDLRGLNNATVADRHPLPRIEDLTETVRGCKWLTTLDLKSAFNSYQIHPADRHKTAFYAGDYGLQQFNRLTMGLQNAPAIFQRLVEKIFADYIGTSSTDPDFKGFCKIYLDDIIIYSKTWAEHKRHVSLIMKRLQQAGLKLNAEKGFFGQREVMYCGFIISGDSTRPNPKLCTAITGYPRPKDLKQVMSFLGMVNFFRFYIKDFADIAAPLYALTKLPYNKRRPPDIQQHWTVDHDKSFEGLKQALISEPVLAQPDFSKPFTLHTDASGSALGAVLTQDDDDNNPRAVGYASRVLTDVERRYSATETECLAVIWACEAFRHYLHGHHFNLYSDHQALQFLMGGGASRSTNRKHHRWLAELQSYQFTICHRPGAENVVPDALSRCYSLQAHERPSYLSALLVSALQDLSYTIHHRPISIAGFTISAIDEYDMPVATPSTLAACLACGHSPISLEPDPAFLSELETQYPTQQVIIADGPTELPALLAAPFAAAPLASVHSSDIILLPDPSKFHGTSHDEWIQYTDLYTPVPTGDQRPGHTAFVAMTRFTTPRQSRRQPPVHLPKIDSAVVPLPSVKPLHCLELCGGLGVFLEALLRSGYTIGRYTYVDSDTAARAAISYRLDCLHARYPKQLPVAAFRDCFALPQNVHQLTEQQLIDLPQVDFLAAGPPCQNFSTAGPQLGWHGTTSRVFPAVLHILRILMQHSPLTYVIENVPSAATQFPEISSSLGTAIIGDAIDHGSAAYRRTAFWTNLSSHDRLQHHITTPSVQHRWTVAQFMQDLGLNSRSGWSTHAATPQFFNKFVRTHGSHAHRPQRDGRPGPSQLLYRGVPIELPPILRAIAMGFDPWDTRPPCLTTAEHHELLGNAIDINLATHLIKGATTVTCCGSCQLQHRCQFDGLCACSHCAASVSQPCQVAAVHTDTAQQQWRDAACFICKDIAGEDNMVECDGCGITLHLRCLSPPRQTAPSGSFFCPACDPKGLSATNELYMPHTPLQYRENDPYLDIDLLDFLADATLPYNATPSELAKFKRQAASYRKHPTQDQWIQVHKGAVKRWRTVPPREYRLDIIRVFHDSLAHSGTKATLSHLTQYFTWIGIANDVASYISDCDVCQRKNRMQLIKDPQPFDLYGPFEHVLMDSCGPFWIPNPAYVEPSGKSGKSGKKQAPGPDKFIKAWVIVIVDYFTKIAEFPIVTDHSSATVAAAVYDAWLSRYPKPRKWTTDQGTENKGAVTQLLHRLGIPHVTTAVFNPTANGACERLVGTLKRMLVRMIGNHESAWPRILPHVRAAYMRRIHRATGYAPMHMLTGFPAEMLLPLGDLLGQAEAFASSLSLDTSAHRLRSAALAAPSLHWRTDIDSTSPFDTLWMRHHESPIIISNLTAAVNQELDLIDTELQLEDLTQSLLYSTKYMQAADAEREKIYAQARTRLTKHQLENRERFLKILQSRPGQHTFDVRPGDLVLIHNQDNKGLRLPLLGPFQVVRVTTKGNVIVQSRPTDSSPPKQWSVVSNRVYPYKYAHQCYDLEATS